MVEVTATVIAVMRMTRLAGPVPCKLAIFILNTFCPFPLRWGALAEEGIVGEGVQISFTFPDKSMTHTKQVEGNSQLPRFFAVQSLWATRAGTPRLSQVVIMA